MDRADMVASLECPCRSGRTFGQCCLAANVDLEALRSDILTSMRRANIAPEFVYAFERTGLIVVSIYRERFSAADLDEWDDAVCEYREKHPHN